MEQAQLLARKNFPEAFQKKSGVGAEFKEGLASLIGGTKTALTAPFDPKEAAKRGLLEEQARGAEFESTASLDKVKKAYADYGLLGGAGEVMRQAPSVIAGMAPQTMATLGATATGARLGAVAGLPGIIGGGLAGFGSSFLPQSGQNITRQAEEQQRAGQEINPNLAAAYSAGAGQAALETVSLGFGLGKRLVSKVLGESEEQIAKGLTRNAAKYEADLVKAAEATLIPTVAKGAARGLVEIPTEVAQQILERAQAGLELFSPDALKEYGESAYQAGIGGSFLGGAAGPISRSSARGDLDALRAQQRATQRKEELAKEEERKASPEYITELTTRRDEIQEELGVLKNILKTKPTDEEEKFARSELKARKRDLDLEMQNLVSSLREVTPEDKGLPLTSQQLVDRERNRIDEVATLKQLRATDSRAADDYAKYIRAQDVYQAMQDKEAQRQLNVQEKARQKEAKAIIDAHNQSVKGIEKTAGAVTDEFGNIVPGLTKQGALAGRELSVEQRIKLEEYDNALKELNDKLAASGGIKRQNLYDKTYVSNDANLEEIDQLKQNIRDKYEGIKDFAGERVSPPQAEETIDKIIAQVSKPEQAPIELTPEQKEAETKRVADLQKYKNSFYDADAYYKKLLDEAEERAEQPRNKGKRGQELYAETKEGRSLEVLKKGEELQAALDSLNKAKGQLINYLYETTSGSGTVVSPAESSEALKDIALLDLTDTIDSMRKGEFFGGPNPAMATGSISTKATKARKELDRYIKILINSINAAREAKGLGKLSEKSVNEIQDKFLELFGGKIARATGKKARELKAGEKPAEDTNMRQAFEAAGFKFKELPKGETEIKTGFSRAEFADVKDFAKDIQDQYTVKEREFGKLTPETTGDLFGEGRKQDTGKARKTEGAATDIEETARLLDKVLDADLTGAQRSVFERAETLLAEGKRTKDIEAETASGVKKVIPGLVDAVTEQGNRVLAGLEPDLKDIREAIKRIEEAFATPVQTQPSGKPATQLEFFPGETSTIRANQENFSRLLSVQRRKGSAVINAARKFLARLKGDKPSAAEFAKLFDNQNIWELLKEATKLDAEGAKLLRKGKNKYRAEADQAFQMADEFRKEAYDVYAAAEKDILKKIEKLDKPADMLAQFEAQKKKIQSSIKETLAKQAKEQVERNMPEYPERIKMLRLQDKTISKAIKSTKERIAEEQAAASRQIGLGLPGKKSTIPVQEKITAQLPHRYDAVQTPFNFARQYFKEMMGRRSITMNKKQVEAYQQASAKYKESRTKLNKVFKENNVDARIATIMNNMVEMDDGTREYRKLENNILGIEELLEQKVLGTQAKNVVTPIETIPKRDVSTDKALGYETPKIVKDEDFVGRISEKDLAAMRKKQNDELEKAKSRLYGLSLQGKEKQADTEKERAGLALQIAQLEKDIKATDVILSARRVGMAVGKAQEEMGAKRFKPSETEKAMTKAGKFEKAGVAPEYYATVAQAFKSRKTYAEGRKTKAEKQTPDYVKKTISRIAFLETELKYRTFEDQYGIDPYTEKRVLFQDVAKQKKDLQEEIDELKKDLTIAVTRVKSDLWTKAFNQVMDTNFRTKTGKVGGIDPVVADGFINNMFKKQGVKEQNGVVTLASGVKFVYAKDMSQAPDAFINAAIAANKDLLSVQGGVLPDGTVVIIGNAHTDVADLEETIAHELLGHYAVDTVLGPQGLKALAKKVFSAGDAGAYQLAAELGVYSDAAEAFAAAKMNNMSAEEMQLLVTREMVAHVAERPLPSKASQALKDFIKMLVNAVRKFFTGAGLERMAEATTQDIYKLIREATKQYESGQLGAYMSPNGDVVFKGPNRYGSTVSQGSIDTFEKMYAKKQTLFDKFLANFTGMSGRMQWFDNLAGFEQILNKAEENQQITSEDALKANYYMRLYGQRLNLTAQFTTHGVSQVTKNSAGELDLIERPDAANLINVTNILEKAKALGNPKVINQFFQTYLVAKRVERVGLKALNVDLDITEKDLKQVKADIERAGVESIFKEAATEYAKYNKSLIDFAVKMGAIPKEEGARLTRYDDYVPFYRVNKDGAAELLIAGERPIRIGDIATQPYLKELVGGKEMLVDFETSAFQNTGVLVDLAMRTMATTTLMEQLSKIGGKDRIAVRVKPKSKGTNIIHGKVDGYEAAWKLDTTDTGFEDIPADLLVKGLEGIKTTLPAIVKGMGLPARFLRTMITRTPTYVVNQIVKDSTAMWMYSGADIKPVLSATKELGTMLIGKNLAEKELQAAGIEGGQLFTGMPEDQAKAFLQIMGGKNTMQSLFVKADRLAMKADAATRVAMYNAYIKKGMSPMRAKLTVLEALNYNKRGLSATVNMLATVIPFMNTQIQGLDILAKAFRGKLTLGQQKDLRAKLWRRGTALGLFTVAYAALMSDDEAYKNADPWTKYTSWFIRVPFFDEPLRVPAPFEFGYVFKALPEAVYGMAFKDEKLSNVVKFYRQAAMNSIPVGIPQAIKPAIEAYTGTSFYTGQGIESAREKSMLPGFRERNNTTEASKLIASIAPEYLSPVMLDYMARAYGGGLTVAMASVLNPFLAPTSDIVAPEKTSSQLPLIGGFFQPNDAPGVINAAYEISNRAQQAGKTFNDLVNSGQKEKATALLNKFKSEIVMQEAAGSFVREMGELSALERLLSRGNVPGMSASDKTAKLKEVRAAKIKIAEMFSQSNKAVSERV
jgi:hypothetical protein